MRLLLVGSLVMFVFALIAAAAAAGTLFTVTWPVWVCAGLVAYVADLLVGDHVTT